MQNGVYIKSSAGGNFRIADDYFKVGFRFNKRNAFKCFRNIACLKHQLPKPKEAVEDPWGKANGRTSSDNKCCSMHSVATKKGQHKKGVSFPFSINKLGIQYLDYFSFKNPRALTRSTP